MDKAKGELSQFEKEILDAILEGDHPVLEVLRQQVRTCRVRKREFTGAGFYTWLTVPPDAPQTSPSGTFTLSGAHAELAGLDHGAGFVLFVTNGILDNLEGFSYDEPWPETMGTYTISRSSLADSHTISTLNDVEKA